MILAYCPALDFNLEEAKMTFEQLVEIINDTSKTPYQKAADLHALLNQSPPPAKPVKARKSRGPNKPKPLVLTNGTEQNQDVS